jgi:hypothetical protein
MIGQPHYFRCSNCRRSRMRGTAFEGGHAGMLSAVTLTGRRRVNRTSLGGRSDSQHEYEYTCKDCSHVGWSRHQQIANRWLREHGEPQI